MIIFDIFIIIHLRSKIVKSRSVVTFCHNDLQEGNILLPKAHSGNIRIGTESETVGNDGYQNNNSLTAFNPKDPRLVLIDFEYASYNYRLKKNLNFCFSYTKFKGIRFRQPFCGIQHELRRRSATILRDVTRSIPI